MFLCVVFSVKSSPVNQTEVAHNFTEAARLQVYRKLHMVYFERAY